MKLPGYIIGLLVLCLHTSCDTDDSTLPGQTEPEEEIELALISHLRQYAGEPKLPLPQGTVVGVYAASYNQPPATSSPNLSNIRCVSDLQGNLNSYGLLKLQEGEDYSFYAYAPYKTGTSDFTDTIPFVHGEDVLLCTGKSFLRNVSYDNRSVSFDFIHLTAQIRFVVKVIEDSSIGDLQSTSVFHASGFIPEARLNLSTGELLPTGDASEQTDVKAAAALDEHGLYSLSSDPVCFFTTSGEQQTFHLRVTHAGITYTGDISALFVPGESSTYTVWIGSKTGLEVTVSIVAWINRYESIDIH